MPRWQSPCGAGKVTIYEGSNGSDGAGGRTRLDIDGRSDQTSGSRNGSSSGGGAGRFQRLQWLQRGQTGGLLGPGQAEARSRGRGEE